MQWRRLILSAATVACAVANEHDRDREDRDFRELDGRGESTWWVWGIVGLVFFLCILGLCAAWMFDWKFDGDDGYENPSATAYASTRTFPIIPTKKAHRHHEHHDKKHGKKRSNMVVPIFSDMPISSPAFTV